VIISQLDHCVSTSFIQKPVQLCGVNRLIAHESHPVLIDIQFRTLKGRSHQT